MAEKNASLKNFLDEVSEKGTKNILWCKGFKKSLELGEGQYVRSLNGFSKKISFYFEKLVLVVEIGREKHILKRDNRYYHEFIALQAEVFDWAQWEMEKNYKYI